MQIGFSANTCLFALSAFSMCEVRNTGGVTRATTSASVCNTLSIASRPVNEVSGETFQISSGLSPAPFANFLTLSAHAAILSE